MREVRGRSSRSRDEVQASSTDADLPPRRPQGTRRRLQGGLQEDVGTPFPQDPREQLKLARWKRSSRAGTRRGPSATAASMRSPASRHGRQRADDGLRQHGRGLGHRRRFTRDPSTGEKVFYGEFLINAQGEDVVAGIRTPQPLDEMPKPSARGSVQAALDIKAMLEKHYKDMQDIEFTIERGELYMLQTRTGKRTGAAALKIAVDMVKRRPDHAAEALRSRPKTSTSCCTRASTPAQREERHRARQGLPASPGAASGIAALHRREGGRESPTRASKVILVRVETSPRTSTACTPPAS
jgi:pyruvate,orthophosphate dikinase